MVRPQPGQLVTCGMKLRMPRDCRICWPQRTSSVRSPPGVGVRLDADGVADACEQQRSEAGGGGDDAFHAHAGFGEAEV